MSQKGSGVGYYVDKQGYLRITRRGAWHNKFVHRKVMSEMCSVYCFHKPLNSDGLPEGFDVHHIDMRKQHNCPGNLLLIDHNLHYAMDILWRRNQETGTYTSCTEPPDWVTQEYGEEDD